MGNSLPTSFSGGATSRKTPRVPVQPLQHGRDPHLGWKPPPQKEPNREVNLSVCDDSRGAAHQKWLRGRSQVDLWEESSTW